MRIFTILTDQNIPHLLCFVAALNDLPVTGLTIFVNPALVVPPQLPPDETPAHFLGLAEAAASRKDYKLAAKLEEQAERAKQREAENAKKGLDWLVNAIEPLKEKTQVVVLGQLLWKSDLPFTQENFLSKLGEISGHLTGPGIGGIKQKTSLFQRVFIPQGVDFTVGTPVVPTPKGQAPAPAQAQGTPAVDRVDTLPTGLPEPPDSLPEDHKRFASNRLGLDRGGSRRSKNEAGNMMGLSPYLASKMETEVIKGWPEFEQLVNA
jgi:hypothetical protein